MKTPFFVGYLPFPKALKPFFGWVVPLFLLAGIAFVYLISSDVPAAGTGTWNAYDKVSITGVVKAEPYPMIITEERVNHPVLIVQLGKLAATEILAPLDGKTVLIEGFMIERGPWQMMEIEGPESVVEAPALALAPPLKSAGMYVSLVGEIVDSKCMLGVMKPGAGKVHRDCAELCVLGGMPPMLLVKNDQGEKAAYLLVDQDGNAVGRRLIPHIALPVEVEGFAFRMGDMTIIKVDPTSVQALQGPAKLAFGESIGIAGSSSFCRIPG